MSWWEEIKSSNLYFGGATGMCSLVVAMVWWGKLLEDRPNGDLINYLRTLADIDRSIASVIREKADPLRKSTPDGSSSRAPTVAPSPQPRGSKRVSSGEGGSRKRLRTGKV